VNLLDVDRVSRGAVEPVRKETDLGDLIARVSLGLDPEERRDIELPRQHVSASVDEGLVERMVANLLGNAVRHTPTGTPVSVRVLEEDGGVVLCVDDRGPGVPDDLKETVFEPFERGSVDSVVGSGVGLYLVASFAELHGGRAWVQDAVDGGASFRVFFPGTLRNGVPPSPPISPPG
jgi:two-component system, OmpR family, sensor histidine kinase KdpD